MLGFQAGDLVRAVAKDASGLQSQSGFILEGPRDFSDSTTVR